MRKNHAEIKPLILFIVFIWIISAFFAIGTVTGYATSADTQLKLCDKSNYQGNCVALTDSEPDLSKKLQKDSLSSAYLTTKPVSLPVPYIYFLCIGKNYGSLCKGQNAADMPILDGQNFYIDGSYKTTDTTDGKIFTNIIVHNYKDVKGSFNDNVDSVILVKYDENVKSYEPPFPIFCTDDNYQGVCTPIRNFTPFIDYMPVNYLDAKLESMTIQYVSEDDQGYAYNFDNRVTSLIIPSGWMVTIYLDNQFGGAAKTFTGPISIPNLGTLGWDNKISSVFIAYKPSTPSQTPAEQPTGANYVPPSPTGSITLCTENNYNGVCQTYKESNSDISTVFRSNGASSLNAQSGSANDIFFACVRTEYRWPCRKVVGDISDLKALAFNVQLPVSGKTPERTISGDFSNKVRSIMVVPYDSVTKTYNTPLPLFCTDSKLDGECLRVKGNHNGFVGYEITDLDVGVLPYSPTIGAGFRQKYHFDFDDTFSSVAVPYGWSVTLYSDKDYKGSSKTLTGPLYIENLNTIGFNDKITSISAKAIATKVVSAPTASTGRQSLPDVVVYHDPKNPVKGNIVGIFANAIDDKGMASISVFQNGFLKKTCKTTGAFGSCIYYANLQQENIEGATYNYFARVVDSDGNTVDSDIKEYTISRAPLTPPSIAVTASPANPVEGQAVTITAKGTTANAGMKEIEIMFDGGTIRKCDDFAPDERGDFACAVTVYPAKGSHYYWAFAWGTDSAVATDPQKVAGLSNSGYVLTVSEFKDIVAPQIDKVYLDPEAISANQAFSVVAEVSDNVKVSTVNIWVDNAKKTCTINAKSGRCQYDFPNGFSAAGTHTYLVEVLDAVGNSVRSTPKGAALKSFAISAAQQTSTKDTTPPNFVDALGVKDGNVKMTNAGVKASDCVITATAADDRTLRKIEIYLNGQLKSYNDFSAVKTGTVTYTENFGWQTGTYNYYAIAYDLYMNKYQSGVKSFTVSDTANKNCKYVESSCPPGETKDIKTGMCKPNLGGTGGLPGFITGGFAITANIVSMLK